MLQLADLLLEPRALGPMPLLGQGDDLAAHAAGAFFALISFGGRFGITIFLAAEPS
jgi:hypothetical protein